MGEIQLPRLGTIGIPMTEGTAQLGCDRFHGVWALVQVSWAIVRRALQAVLGIATNCGTDLPDAQGGRRMKRNGSDAEQTRRWRALVSLATSTP